MKMRVAAAALGILLSACQTATIAPEPSNAVAGSLWESRLESLSAISHFELRGRIASNSLGGGSADLSWTQSGDHFQVSLSGTLGIGAVRIEGTPDDLEIVTKDGRHQADAARQALTEQLGAPLPVDDLPFWVKGIPRPGIPSSWRLDPSGQLSHLEQEGWQLDYLEYRDNSPQSPSLPRKLWLSRGDNRWKLVVDEWRLPQSTQN